MIFRNIIFDWSGTLCDDLALTVEATNYVFEQYQIPTRSIEEFRAEFFLPYPVYYQGILPDAPTDEVEDHFRYAFSNAQNGVTLLPHARRFLEYCASASIRCFVLTSADSKAFAKQARELGVDSYFEHIHSSIRNKEVYIGQLMQQHGLRSEETAFIGDMTHDIDAAHCASITGIAVLTGYNNAQQLATATPDLIVPDLAALQRLLEKGQPAASSAASDHIHLSELRFECCIGVPDDERATPQALSANITIELPTRFSEMADQLDNTICYDTLTQTLILRAQEAPIQLIETLAHKLARCCVEEFGANAATVELHKFIMPQMSSSAVRTSYSRRSTQQLG